MLIIPAIDILGGKCVRLYKGDYGCVTEYSDDPVEVALRFEKDGAKYLHIVDLDGARDGRPVNLEVILKIISAVKIPVQVGGGVRNYQDAAEYLEKNVSRIILGTSAITDPELIENIIQNYGSDRIVISLDIKDGKIAMEGWQKNSKFPVVDFLNDLISRGVERIIITDVSRDGTLNGPNLDLIKKLNDFDVQVIAAGGVSNMQDLKCLEMLGIEAAITGKAVYEGKIGLCKNDLAKRIIPCMDVDNGRVKKGVNFVNLRDAGDPVVLGKIYSEAGADELVFLDITATLEKRNTLVELVKRVSENVFIPFTVGGGIKSLEDIKAVLNAGADKVSIGSEAVYSSEFIKEASGRFGSQCIVISLDCKREGDSWKLYVKGGREKTEFDAVEFAIKMEAYGAGELLVNSLDRDGTRQGYDLNLLKAISEVVNIPVIASSGAGRMKDFLDAFEIVDACLAASLFHDQKLIIRDLKEYLINNNLTIRT